MTKPYTIREAIGELDTIRMEANTPGSDLPRLVSELSSVMSWFVIFKRYTPHYDPMKN